MNDNTLLGEAPHPAFGHPLPAARGEGAASYCGARAFSPLRGARALRATESPERSADEGRVIRSGIERRGEAGLPSARVPPLRYAQGRDDKSAVKYLSPSARRESCVSRCVPGPVTPFSAF